MKFVMIPCDLYNTKPYSNIIRGENKKLYGWFMSRTILSLSKEFRMGDWIRGGFKGLPYAYWFSKETIFYELGLKTKEEENQYTEFIELCKDEGIFHSEDDELNIYIEWPDMMKMVDETQIKATYKAFGKGKLSKDDIKNIIEDKSLESRMNLEHSRANNTKQDNTKLNNKLNSNNKSNINTPHVPSPKAKGTEEVKSNGLTWDYKNKDELDFQQVEYD